VFQLDPHLVLTIEADDSQKLCDTAENYTQIAMHEGSSCNKSTFDTTHSDNTPIGSKWSSSSAGVKGLTYPSHFDDVMAGLSYCYALPSGVRIVWNSASGSGTNRLYQVYNEI